MKPVSRQVRWQVEDKDTVYDQVDGPAYWQVYRQVWEQVYGLVYRQVTRQIREYIP